MKDQPNEKELRILESPQANAAAHDSEQEGQEEHSVEQEHRLDLAEVRETLRGKSGKHYWRTLEELADHPHFEDLLNREFPRHASEWDNAVDRRDFMKLMGASLALAGLAGCGRPDIDKIVPYVKQPDGNIDVTIRQLRDPVGLQGTLRRDGLPAVVDFNGQPNPACQLYPAISRALALRIVQPQRPGARTGATVLIIHPSALPSAAGVQIVTTVSQRHTHVNIDLVYASPQCTG